MSDRHRLLMAQNLLKEAARLYEKHEAGRPEPFNVFSVLHSESDEVNLHSRFLHALLDYQKPEQEIRENLADFLQHVGIKDFEQRNVKVERERYHIDILITNEDKKEGVAIENKIWAGDQHEQIMRYHQTLKKQEGYSRIYLLYLTPDGRDPSKDSVGDLECTAISYKYDLQPWLRRCQRRAYDEPGLRESVAQYLQLVQKLTGTDFKEEYMKELKELCLEGNNLVLVHDLNEAMIDAKACLLAKLWDEIDCALKEQIPDRLSKYKDGENVAYSVSDERIKRFLTNQRGTYHGLYYSFGSGVASLGVEAGNGVGLIFGIRCHKDRREERSKLEKELKNMRGNSSDWWIRYQKDDKNLKTPTRDNLTLLSNEADRKKHAKQIAQRLKPFWDAVKAAGLA